MRFVVSSNALLKHLQQINGVISANTVLPILEDFLFNIDKGKLDIFATDLETSMSTSMEVESNDKHIVAIPARIITDILKSLPEQPIAISIDEVSNAVELTTDNGKYRLAGENGADFPKMPTVEGDSTIEIPADVLFDAINKTLFAVSADDLRPAMGGVYFLLNANGITFVSTDAHKLVKLARTDISGFESETSFIVPKKALGLLKASLPQTNTSVKISFNKTNAFFSFDETNLICRLIDARYPDYNAVIPTQNPNLLTINRQELLGALKRISIFSNKSTHLIAIKIAGSELTVSAQDLDFSNEAAEKLSCEYIGEDMEIGFNAKFLIEMLNTINSDEVRFELESSTRAGILRPADKDEHVDLIMLVMPVMINR